VIEIVVLKFDALGVIVTGVVAVLAAVPFFTPTCNPEGTDVTEYVSSVPAFEGAEVATLVAVAEALGTGVGAGVAVVPPPGLGELPPPHAQSTQTATSV
jgi:hypothetical protein